MGKRGKLKLLLDFGIIKFCNGSGFIRLNTVLVHE